MAIYTVELGIAPDDREYTMLCSWVDGRNINYGDGPKAEPAVFLQAVSAKLQNEHEMNLPGHDGIEIHARTAEFSPGKRIRVNQANIGRNYEFTTKALPVRSSLA